MAKGAYLGINNIARKIKKGYIGVNGVAKKIKKAYIGVAGIARLCWSGGELKYKGQGVISLAETRSNLTGAATKNHAFFFGGTYLWNNLNGAQNTVEAFDKNLTRYNAANMVLKETDLPCGAIGNYAIVAEYYAERLYSYSNELTSELFYNLRTNKNMYVTAYSAAGLIAGNQVLFVTYKYGGSSSTAYQTPVTVSEDLTVSNLQISNYLERANRGTSFNGCAVYGGNLMYRNIFVIDENLTEATYTDILYGNRRKAGAFVTAGNHLLVGGGVYDNGDYDADCGFLDIIDENWTSMRGDNLPEYGYPLGASVGEYGIIAFGQRKRWITTYNAELTVTLQQQATYGRFSTKPVTFGEYAMFAGGCGNYMNQASDYEFSSIELFSIE